MRRWLIAAAILAACAQSTPVSGSSTAPGTDDESKPGAAKFEPVKLTEEQLKRARAVQPLVAKAARDHGIDPNLLNGIIYNESKFNPKARNPKSGAAGLMQLMPGTSKAMARRLERPNKPYDPKFATQAGAKLLSILSKKFDGDINLMLFGYARGSGTVRKWQDSNKPMPEGVLKFIAKVKRAQATFEQMGFPEKAR